MKTKDIEILPGGRLDTVNTGLYLDKAPKTLAMMRCKGTGPPFIKRGKIYYFKEDLDRWIAEGAGFKSTAQARLANLKSKHCELENK